MRYEIWPDEYSRLVDKPRHPITLLCLLVLQQFADGGQWVGSRNLKTWVATSATKFKMGRRYSATKFRTNRQKMGVEECTKRLNHGVQICRRTINLTGAAPILFSGFGIKLDRMRSIDLTNTNGPLRVYTGSKINWMYYHNRLPRNCVRDTCRCLRLVFWFSKSFPVQKFGYFFGEENRLLGFCRPDLKFGKE